MKPFLKWVGGKTQLLPIINDNLPENIDDIKTYIEPFIGGGSVMFDIVPKFKNIEHVIINDLNTNLTNLYKCIKSDNYKKLINNLKQKEDFYLDADGDERKNMFYLIRMCFNSVPIINEQDIINKCADFIFLNKTCFNGLYRVNKKGEFNVPWNKAKTPCICDEETISNAHEFLNKYNVEIYNEQYFSSFIDYNIYKGTAFIYLDPPYRPITKSAAFTAYTQSPFNDVEQRILSNYCDIINQQGHYFMLSNSDPKNSDINDNFFDDLYRKYNILRVSAKRNINSKGNKRGYINELLIKNY